MKQQAFDGTVLSTLVSLWVHQSPKPLAVTCLVRPARYTQRDLWETGSTCWRMPVHEDLVRIGGQ